MKQYITLGLFLFISLFSLSATAQNVIFSEDFSGVTTGDNTTTGGSGTTWNGNSNFTVDANSKAYQAGGAVKLGTGSAVGYITTVPLDLSQGGGDFSLTFDVKGWTTVEGNIKVTVTGLANQTATYTATIASAFETKTLNFTGGTANATIRIETSAKRAFIDNVTVSVPETLDAPVATAATNITFHSFEATWEEVEGASYYTLQVSTTPDFATILPGFDDWEAHSPQNVPNVTGNTTYYYRVVAVNGDTVSDFSNVIEVTTACGPFMYPAVNHIVFCGSATIADLPLSLDEYHWYISETGGAPLTGDTVLSTGIIYYTNYFDICESPRQGYSVTVNTVAVPEIEDNEVEVCHSGTIADITPEGSGYNWYADATGGTALAATAELANGTLYVSKTEGDCESARIAVTVEIEIPEVPAGNSTQDFTEGETLADLDVTADDELVWYTDADMTTMLPATTPLVDGTTYYAVNADETCMSTAVPFTVNMVMGLPSSSMAGLIFYPNPVQETFTMSYTNALDSITVYNTLGQAVIENTAKAESVAINTSGLTAGTYFVKVVSGTEAKTIKVVKQ